MRYKKGTQYPQINQQVRSYDYLIFVSMFSNYVSRDFENFALFFCWVSWNYWFQAAPVFEIFYTFFWKKESVFKCLCEFFLKTHSFFGKSEYVLRYCWESWTFFWCCVPTRKHYFIPRNKERRTNEWQNINYIINLIYRSAYILSEAYVGFDIRSPRISAWIVSNLKTPLYGCAPNENICSDKIVKYSNHFFFH